MTRHIRMLMVLACAGVITMAGARTLSVPAYAATQEIAAVVNEDAISMQDVKKRMKLIMASSGLPNNKEIRERLTRQVLNSLINEQVMLQEARKLGIEVTEKEVQNGFATVAGQNKMKPEQFKSMIKRGGIDISTMRQQIEAQVAWSKVVQKKLRPRVTVSERDINDAQERLQAKLGTTEYLTAEIFLPIDDAKSERDVRTLAHRLVREIKSGKASFFKLAQQFSKSAGAMQGGDVGWLQETHLNEEILKGLKSVNKNQVAGPIKTLSGYHILFLRNTRTLTEDTMPSREQIHHTLGTERLEKLQRRHLMDLRAASFIDVRI